MRDYNYITDAGERIPVMQMDESDIDQILCDGDCVVHTDDGLGETKNDVLERLRIEKIIRHLDKSEGKR